MKQFFTDLGKVFLIAAALALAVTIVSTPPARSSVDPTRAAVDVYPLPCRTDELPYWQAVRALKQSGGMLTKKVYRKDYRLELWVAWVPTINGLTWALVHVRNPAWGRDNLTCIVRTGIGGQPFR